MQRKPHIDIDPITGDTLLHSKVRGCTHVKNVYRFIKQLDPKIAGKMARIPNKQGQLPLDLAKEGSLKKRSKKNLYSFCLNLARAHTYNNLSSDVNLAKILARYNVQPNTEMFDNLTIGAEIIKEVRQIIIESYTHPEINNRSSDYKNKLRAEIKNLREDIRKTPLQFNELFECLVYPEALEIKTSAPLIQQRKIGNCQECAYLGAHLLKNKYPKIYSEVWRIKNGDHVFLVIGKAENRVVCDPWSGKTYPFYAIQNELKDYRFLKTLNSFQNVCTFYNPHFHQLEPVKLMSDLQRYLLIATALGILYFSLATFLQITMRIFTLTMASASEVNHANKQMM